MPAPPGLKELVKRYEDNWKQYSSPSYKEAELRKEFINPLFEMLGWDIYNKKGRPEQYKEVVDEPSLEVEGGTKAPDYAFRLGEVTKFYVEAKKPFIKITTEPLPAFQLKRYAFSAKLPLSILTNFEDISVYDCRFKPEKTDNVTKGRILHIDFQDLEERWDELTNIFSPEAIWQGSFDKYVAKKKRGTTEVDVEILKDIEGWREELARNIALRNNLNNEELNFAVQRLIDRILFLRICEDRGTEPENQLYDIMMNKKDIYRHLVDIFQLADAKYNSGLFHFMYDKKRTATKPDRISPFMKVDDKVIASIIWDLYYPNSPYQFDVIPADILGHVYEQFLGRVIRLQPSGKRAVVEEKLEVKKAGGVYYTPTYIVEYIVENTVGKICEGKSPDEMASMKILDPACGSGSFLIVAYYRLLKEHLKWYEANKPKKHKEKVFLNQKGAWQLTLQEKKRILLNNIHGVDIDSQAVEVTKLNLLLKALEGESKESIDNVKKWFREPALPDLGTNIKCGNSLIDFDIIDHLQDLDEVEQNKELARINPFNWQEEFPEIMKTGGFDAVVGNPPYLRIQGLQEYYGTQIDYLVDKFHSAVKRFDFYLLFIENGFQLIKKGGWLGYICPHKFLNSDFGSGLREFLIEEKALNSILNFGHNLIFKNASTYTGIFLLKKEENITFRYYKFDELNEGKLKEKLFSINDDDHAIYDLDGMTKNPWILMDSDTKCVLDKLFIQKHTIGNIFEEILVGVQTGIDAIHILEFIDSPIDSLVSLKSEKEGPVKLEKGLVKPFLMGEDVKRYDIPKHSHYCIYPYHLVNNKTKIIEEDILENQYPNAYEYLKRYYDELKSRRISQKTNPKYWYSCHRNRNMAIFEKERIITPYASLGCNMTIASPGQYHNTKCYSLVPKIDRTEHLFFWLGILNSPILWFFMKNTGYVLRGGYYTFTTDYLSPFPIRTINFDDPEDVTRHDKMVELVERMLKLHKDLLDAKTSDAETRIQRQINATDREIDNLVYELYGLSENEIKILQGVE